MDTRTWFRTNPVSIAATLAFGACLALAAPFTWAQAQHYTRADLTANLGSLAPQTDGNLVNAWGLSRSTGGAWWVSDNGTGLSTLYDGTGKTVPLVVTIPSSEHSSAKGSPTGTIFNGDPNLFPVAPGKGSIFLFVTEDGTISGWNPQVKPTEAIIVVDTKGKSVFKGVTAATVESKAGAATYLYAADFRRGRVAVYDGNFKPVSFGEDSFQESRDADHEQDRDAQQQRTRGHDGFAPFNIQNIGGNLYVAYAKQDSAKHDEVDGAGLGFVNVYSPYGRFLHRLESGPWFNAPWGLALASGDFGAHSHDVLVGQFGSGEILAFDSLTGAYKGQLLTATNDPIRIDGLWAIAFGGDNPGNGPATSLYFAAGPGHESNGLFGKLTAVENVQGNDR